MQFWRSPLERYESYDELILWFEHDLFDQLNVIQSHVPGLTPEDDI